MGQNPTSRNSNWWLASLLFPICSISVGIIFAINAPRNQSDWFGSSVLIPIFLGLLVGCVLSIVAAVISFARRERLCWIALLPAVPSFLSVICVCGEFVQIATSAEKNREAMVASQKREQARQDRINQFRDQFRTNTLLLTSDEFWSAQANYDHLAQIGLHRLLADQSFRVSPEVAEYLLNRFVKNDPQVAFELKSYDRIKQLNTDETFVLIQDQRLPRDYRQRVASIQFSGNSIKLNRDQFVVVLKSDIVPWNLRENTAFLYLRNTTCDLTNDVFWNTLAKAGGTAAVQNSLSRVISDPTFDVTPQFCKYVLARFHNQYTAITSRLERYPLGKQWSRAEQLEGFRDDLFDQAYGETQAATLFHASSQDELVTIIEDNEMPRRYRQIAAEILCSSRSLVLTDELKKYLLENYPGTIEQLIAVGRWREKSDLQAVVNAPNISEDTKDYARNWLTNLYPGSLEQPVGK